MSIFESPLNSRSTPFKKRATIQPVRCLSLQRQRATAARSSSGHSHCSSQSVRLCLTDLSRQSFPNVSHVKAVRFEQRSAARTLPGCFVGNFSAIRSICVAASIKTITRSAFRENAFPVVHIDILLGTAIPDGLEKVTFEPGSRLREIPDAAFFRY